MARPTLTIATKTNQACTDMTMYDTTANYGGGTVTINSVTQVIVVVNNKSTGTQFTYTFTVLNGVITAATATLDTGIPVNILSQLSSTVWPFIINVNELDLWKTYTNFTQPAFDDAVLQIEYTISGDGYSYTTSVAEMVTCKICCCVSKMWANIDPSCDCSDAAMNNASQADTWLQVALAAADMGDVTKSVNALAKAQALCDCGCSGC